jgi:hypothetical protein
MAELKYEKVKENSEKMATQIFEYIHAAGLTGTERDKLFLELSTSFLLQQFIMILFQEQKKK